jgi:hypothetical protein
LGGRGRQISEFEASLVYRVSSRTARAIQRNTVSKNQKKKKKKKRKKKKNLPAEKQSRFSWFTEELYKTFKEKLIPMFLKIFYKIEYEGTI